MWVLRLAWQSLKNRRLLTGLTILSIALSAALFLTVEKVREGARESFSNTLSQTSLIVGAKGSPIQLLLYTVFHMGSPTSNLSYSSFEKYSKHPAVDWTIPISLGDSHRGFRVVATNASFYEHYRFRQTRSIEFENGKGSQGIFDVVLGSEVARLLRYKILDPVVLSHGVSEGDSIFDHGDKPFRVVGILKPTKTPIDRALFITLEGMEAIHIDWKEGVPADPSKSTKIEDIKKENLQISQITSFLVRTKAPQDILRLQREIMDDPNAALMAIMPGVALAELWRGISYAEDALRAVSLLIIFVGLLGMLISIYTTLHERRREMAILRTLGAHSMQIVFLLVFEAVVLTGLGLLLAIGLVYGGLLLFQPWIENATGVFIPIHRFSLMEWIYIAGVLFGGAVMGMIPALKAYRDALVDGLSLRV